jgi:hypothetical protein
MLANPPWRQLRERAQKIQGDKKHVEKFSHRVISLHSSIPHRNARWPAQLSRIKHNHPNDGCVRIVLPSFPAT